MLNSPLFFKKEDLYKKVLLFDTSWVAYASLLAKVYCDMSFEGKKTGHVFGFMSKILSMFKYYGGADLNNTELIFALDNYPEDIYKEFPEYKGFRIHNFDPIPDTEKLITLFSCYHASAPKTEADSVISSIVKVKHSNHKVYVVSRDKDLWPMLNMENVIITAKSKEYVTSELFNKRFGINNPEYIALHKAIFGDQSDNIPKLPGRLSHKIIHRYIDESDGSPGGFYKIWGTKEKIPEGTYKFVLAGKKQVEKMYRLIRLDFEVKYDLKNNIKTLNDKQKLMDFLHKFGIYKFDESVDCLFYE